MPEIPIPKPRAGKTQDSEDEEEEDEKKEKKDKDKKKDKKGEGCRVLYSFLSHCYSVIMIYDQTFWFSVLVCLTLNAIPPSLKIVGV